MNHVQLLQTIKQNRSRAQQHKSSVRSTKQWVGLFLVALMSLMSITEQRSYRADSIHTQVSATASAVNDPLELSSPSQAAKPLPLYFEENKGQTDPQVDFLARGLGYTLFLTADEVVLTLQKGELRPRGEWMAEPRDERDPAEASTEYPQFTVLRMKLIEANPTPSVEGLEELPGRVNYFLGNDPSEWQIGIPTYAKVRYRHVYPDIDIIYYGNRGKLEFDFVIAPGANIDAITLAFEGADQIETSEEGDLVLYAGTEEVRLHKPIIYQDDGGEKKLVEGKYFLRSENYIGVRVGTYDPSKPLIIDPVLVYSTYLGGTSSDQGNSIAVDSAGNVYVTGWTQSADFPTWQPIQAEYSGGQDVVIAKLGADGGPLLYATYLGGSRSDVGLGIAVDREGNAYVTGWTSSTDFPTRRPVQLTLGGSEDAFIVKLGADGGPLLYATYLGGSRLDEGRGIAVDEEGNAYVTGWTSSTDFPTQRPVQLTSGEGDMFIVKLSDLSTP